MLHDLPPEIIHRILHFAFPIRQNPSRQQQIFALLTLSAHFYAFLQPMLHSVCEITSEDQAFKLWDTVSTPESTNSIRILNLTLIENYQGAVTELSGEMMDFVEWVSLRLVQLEELRYDVGGGGLYVPIQDTLQVFEFKTEGYAYAILWEGRSKVGPANLTSLVLAGIEILLHEWTALLETLKNVTTLRVERIAVATQDSEHDIATLDKRFQDSLIAFGPQLKALAAFGDMATNWEHAVAFKPTIDVILPHTSNLCTLELQSDHCVALRDQTASLLKLQNLCVVSATPWSDIDPTTFAKGLLPSLKNLTFKIAVEQGSNVEDIFNSLLESGVDCRIYQVGVPEALSEEEGFSWLEVHGTAG